ncbi:MAG TPA: cell wall-binding repeat-containing protein [Candidatus Limnocylindria bacterium]|nr:cell wall-binding repeat-containing protein [Candidatus Limnocylindria bacterium]
MNRRVPRLLRVAVAGWLAITSVVVASLPLLAPPVARAVDATVQRIAGADRYATAAAVSAATFQPGTPVAFIATGTAFPDALAAGPAAAALRGPILLVKPDWLPDATRAELLRLRPGRIVVVGGPAAVGDQVLAALDGLHTGGGVTRLAGIDRYATAAAVSAAVFGPARPVVYVATGRTFPDALSGGALAGRNGAPLLLVEPHAIPAATTAELRRLTPAKIVVLGGTGAVSAAVATALDAFDTGGGVVRHAGPDRYWTSAVIASAQPSPAPALFVATGAAFPDALAATPAAVAAGASVLLVPGTSVPPVVLSQARRLAPARLVLVGGPAAINDRVTFTLRVAIGDLAPLPACTYEDRLTAHRGYDAWPRTLLDTVFRVEATYHPGDLVDTSAAGLNGGHRVRRPVLADLAAMTAAARAAGRPIAVVSAFRSHDAQVATFNSWVAKIGYAAALLRSARPGHSEHQLGTTFDFTSAGAGSPWNLADWARTPAGAWMRDNAWRYGFVMSYPAGTQPTTCYTYEPWHYRYFGRQVAAAIRASGLTPREWVWMRNDGG